MTRLFSSFDLKIFLVSCSINLAFGVFFITSFYWWTTTSYYSEKFIKFLSNFFYRLNNSNYSKSFSHLNYLVFFMILSFNVLSLFPYTFPNSSQVRIIFFLSFSAWLSLSLLDMFNVFKSYIAHMTPVRTPLSIIPFLFVIETISILIRPLTLIVRLVANIVAGHLILNLIYKLVSFCPYLFPLIVVIRAVELFVAFIQAYIFVTLVSLYFSE